MRPTHEYYLVTEPWQYAACRKLWKEVAKTNPSIGPVKRFGFPTVAACKGKAVVGFLSSYYGNNKLIAGPLVLAPGSGAVTALRLVEAYEKVLFVMGAQEYLFATDNPSLIKTLERVSQFVPISKLLTSDNAVWYKRTLGYEHDGYTDMGDRE